MAHYEKFEDLPIWQQARAVTSDIYRLTNSSRFMGDVGLRSQMQRAAVSIVSNIAEGFERRSNKEFSQFLNIAKASAGEVRAQLYIALDLDYTDSDQQETLNRKLKELSAQMAGFIKYLGRSKPSNPSDQGS